ncbi:MAG: 1-phosphofructokinase [Clostridia bacterium]|nr:1-phosphofructokinase [Clostridia bacterium]
MITTLALSPAIDKIYFVNDFEAGKFYRVKDVVKSAGGKGVNVARVASILGEKVTTLGFKAGEAGDWLEAKLKEQGVETNFISVEGETRTSNSIIDRKNGTETELLEIGPYVTYEAVNSFLDLYKNLLGNINVLVCSGGLPEGVPEDFYKVLIERAKPHGIKVILDSSNEVLEEGIKAKPYMVKPNLRELCKYANKNLNGINEVIEACERIVEEGVEIVVASMGKDGALLVSKDVTLYSKAPRIDVVNTIGSGDAMVAGFAKGLYRGYDLEEILRLGMACGVVNTLFREVGYIEAKLLDEYKNEIRIEKIRG